MSTVQITSEGDYALVAGQFQSVLFHFENAKIGAKNQEINEIMSRIFVPTFTSNKVAYWGSNNLYPQEVLEIIKSNLTLSAGFNKRCNAIFANGIITKKDKEQVDYQPYIDFVNNHVHWDRDIMQRIRDLVRWGWCTQEMIFSDDFYEVLATKTHKTKNCRKSLQNPRTLFRESVFVNLQWDMKRVEDKEYVNEIPYIYEEFNVVNLLKKRINKQNYIYITELASDEENYPQMPWTSIIESGWLDINNNEPKFIKFLIQNKATLNYAIKIKDWYWTELYKDWKEIGAAEKKKRKKLELDGFNRMMTGVEATGRSIIIDVKTAYLSSRLNEKQVGIQNLKDFQEAWEIVPIPVNQFDGSLKEDSNTARMETMFAIDLDPSTFGSTPQQNRQGGSDKQQSYNIALTTDEYVRRQVIHHLKFIRDYNGWDKNIEFDFDLPVMQNQASMSAKDRNIAPSESKTTEKPKKTA